MKYVEWKGDIFSESYIQKIYNVYLKNIINLASVCDIELIGIFDKTVGDGDDVQYDNGYINTKEKSLVNLGLSVDKIGAYWMFITDGDSMREGNHRYRSLRHLANKGLINKDKKILAVNVHNIFKHPINITFPITTNIEPIKSDNWDVMLETKEFYRYRDCLACILKIPLLLRHIMWEWKEKYGEDFPTSPIVNNYDILISEIEKMESN